MTDWSPADFLKCPNCHRTGTVSLSIHLDGDVSIECAACDALAMAYPLNESDRTYE